MVSRVLGMFDTERTGKYFCGLPFGIYHMPGFPKDIPLDHFVKWTAVCYLLEIS